MKSFTVLDLLPPSSSWWYSAETSTEECKPISAQYAARIGLVDQLVDFNLSDGVSEVKQMVQSLLYNFNCEEFLKQKAEKIDKNEAEKCREHELQQMHHSLIFVLNCIKINVIHLFINQ